MMLNQDRCRRIYNAAFNYLLEFDEVDEALIESHLNDWEEKSPNSLNEIYRGLLQSARSRQGMPNSIGPLSELEAPLYGYSPEHVIDRYTTWQEFFTEIEEHDEISPPGRFDIENKRSHWVQFSKSVLSAGRFLSEFENLAEFSEFVDGFYTNRHTRYSLPLFLGERIHGLQFATACDFLKENGHAGFAKPDTHIRDLFVGMNLSEATDDDYALFLDVIEFAEVLGETPYTVDKLFWILGSGRFPKEGMRVNTSKQEFLKRIENSSETVEN